MGLADVNVVPRSKKGGGLWGKIAGGLAAGIAAAAAVPSGGASLAAIPAAMSAGGMVGGIAGEKIKGSEAKEGKKVPLSAVANDPGVQYLGIEEGQKLIAKDPRIAPDDASQLMAGMEQAKDSLRQRLKAGRGF